MLDDNSTLRLNPNSSSCVHIEWSGGLMIKVLKVDQRRHTGP